MPSMRVSITCSTITSGCLMSMKMRRRRKRFGELNLNLNLNLNPVVRQCNQLC